MPIPQHFLSLLAAILFSLGAPNLVAQNDPSPSEYPNRPIKLIIPFSAGGASDTFSRIIAKAIRDEDLLPQPLVIINVNGASGTIGSRRTKNARPDGYTLMMLHEAILTAKHAGLSPYGAEAFEPVAATGENVMVLAAQKDSPFNSLTEVITHAADNPNEIIYGAAIGAPVHMMGLLLEKQHDGAKFRFTQAGSGAQRISSLTGGHIDLSPFSISEFQSFEAAGIKCLAVFSPERHSLIPNAPTATEQGYPVTSINRNFWWFPKGTPQDRIDTIATALEKAMQTAYVQEMLKKLAMGPTFLSGKALQAEIDDRNAKLSTVTLVQTDAVPNFALWTLGMAITLLTAVFIRRSLRSKPRLADSETPPRPIQPSTFNIQKSYLSFALTLLYAALISFELLSYPIATTLYVLLLSLIVGGFSLRIFSRALPFALLMGFGLFYLFTQFLTIDLPN